MSVTLEKKELMLKTEELEKKEAEVRQLKKILDEEQSKCQEQE